MLGCWYEDETSPRARAVSLVGRDEYVCPMLFDFLTIREIGRAAAVCREWSARAENDELWREMYERTQIGEADMEEWASSLAARPFGEDAVGWEVEVFSEEDDGYRPGLVLGYSEGHYRVEYQDGTWRWECEHRTQGPWHRRGNSRLHFINRLHDSIAGVTASPGAGAPSAAPAEATGAVPGDMLGMDEAEFEGEGGHGRSGPWARVRHGQWREELKANACHVPAVPLVPLNDHTDEVLDLKFSPDGIRLATCSRDMFILIYAIEDDDNREHRNASASNAGAGGGGGRGVGRRDGDGEETRRPLGYGGLSVRLIHRLRRSATASVCRIFWSPCSRFILSCLEEPLGNPFKPSSSELWDAKLGHWLSRCVSKPFDVHAAWLADGKHFVTGLDLEWDQSDDAAPFSQTLAIRRRLNIPTSSRRALGFEPAAASSACCDGDRGGKVDQSAGGIGAVGSTSTPLPTEGACSADNGSHSVDNKVPAAAQVFEATTAAARPGGACELSTAEMEIAEAETGEVRAAEAAARGGGSEAVGGSAGAGDSGDGPWTQVSQGVGWGEEEAMPYSSSVVGSSRDLVAAGDDAADGGTAKRGRRAAGTDDAPMRVGFAREAIIAAAAVETAAKRELMEGAGRGEAAGMVWVDPGKEGAGSRHGENTTTGGGASERFDGAAIEHGDAGSRGGGEALGAGDAALQMVGKEDPQRQTTTPVRHKDEDDQKVGGLGGAKAPPVPHPMDVTAQASDDECNGDTRHGDDHHIERDDASGLDWGAPEHDPLNAWLLEPPAVSSADGGGAGGGGGGGGGGGASGVPLGAVDDGVFGFDFGGGAVAMDHVVSHEGYEDVDGGGQGGGVEWVMEGGEAIATADEVELPLVGEIHLNLGKNFGHFFQISSSEKWACIATGETPVICHRIAFIPLKGPALTAVAPSGRPDQQQQAHQPNSGGLPPQSDQVGDGAGSDQGGSGAGGAASADDVADHNVFIRRVGPTCCNIDGRGGGPSLGQGNYESATGKMETVECGGAVLSLSISRDDRYVMANVRAFADGALEALLESEGRPMVPDISNKVELQVWDVVTKELVFKLGGHHAFTTKECPFLIFAAQSEADKFGDYVCSGSEEHRVYVWHLRHRILLSTLKGHTNVVNSVSWNAKHPGMLASCSDDGTAIIWGPKIR